MNQVEDVIKRKHRNIRTKKFNQEVRTKYVLEIGIHEAGLIGTFIRDKKQLSESGLDRVREIGDWMCDHHSFYVAEFM